MVSQLFFSEALWAAMSMPNASPLTVITSGIASDSSFTSFSHILRPYSVHLRVPTMLTMCFLLKSVLPTLYSNMGASVVFSRR